MSRYQPHQGELFSSVLSVVCMIFSLPYRVYFSRGEYVPLLRRRDPGPKGGQQSLSPQFLYEAAAFAVLQCRAFEEREPTHS